MQNNTIPTVETSYSVYSNTGIDQYRVTRTTITVNRVTYTEYSVSIHRGLLGWYGLCNGSSFRDCEKALDAAGLNAGTIHELRLACNDLILRHALAA